MILNFLRRKKHIWNTKTGKVGLGRALLLLAEPWPHSCHCLPPLQDPLPGLEEERWSPMMLSSIYIAFSFLFFFLSEGARTSKPPWAPKAPGKYHLSTPSVTLTPVAWPKNHTWNFHCADHTDQWSCWFQVKKQDMTLQQLRVYDGESEACDGSICVAGL